MPQTESTPQISVRSILILWAAICCILALFIPHYDFGFDGVKVWFYLNLLTLSSLLVGRFFLQHMKREK